MGSAASFVLVDPSGTHIYYHHWGGTTMPSNLFWGPAVYRARLDSLTPSNRLLKTLWCDGAVVVDEINRVVLLWNRSAIAGWPVSRQVFMDFLRRSWKGWEVYWARYGVQDVARYLNWPVEDVLCGQSMCYEGEELSDCGTGTFVTVRNSLSMLKEHLLLVPMSELLCAGPKVLDYIVATPPAHLPHETLKEHPEGYVLIDLPDRRLCFWESGTVDPRCERHAVYHWKGWHVERHEGGLYEHCRLTCRCWREFLPDAPSVAASIRAQLIPRKGPSPSELFRMAGYKDLGADFDEASLEALFAEDDEVPLLTLQEMEGTLDRILTSWLSEHSSYEECLKTSFDWPVLTVH